MLLRHSLSFSNYFYCCYYYISIQEHIYVIFVYFLTYCKKLTNTVNILSMFCILPFLAVGFFCRVINKIPTMYFSSYYYKLKQFMIISKYTSCVLVGGLSSLIKFSYYKKNSIINFGQNTIYTLLGLRLLFNQEAWILYLGCCTHVGHLTLGYFCMDVPTMSFFKD